jgi:predicted dithiol-disulfide oxidoreductase (DUF899 family)
MTQSHKIVSHDQWIEARKGLLAKEKEFTRLRDELSRQRRALPWERVEKEYLFDGSGGKESLAQLFAEKSQLIVYHFMFPPDGEPCPHCSFWADNFNPVIVHINHRDASMVAISRAPYERIAAYKQRMGWSFKWLSSGHNSFNYDFGASFTPGELREPVFNFGTQAPGLQDREGASVFAKDESGAIFRTYSTHGRGIDLLNTAYKYIDLLPKGRDENGRNQYWVRRHDEYEDLPGRPA